MKKFWIIYNPRLWNSNVYYTKEEALAAKKELEKLNPGVEFTIMENIKDKK